MAEIRAVCKKGLSGSIDPGATPPGGEGVGENTAEEVLEEEQVFE